MARPFDMALALGCLLVGASVGASCADLRCPERIDRIEDGVYVIDVSTLPSSVEADAGELRIRGGVVTVSIARGDQVDTIAYEVE